MPELPPLLPVIRSALSAILGYIFGQTKSPNLSGLAAAINTVYVGLQTLVGEIIRVRMQDQQGMGQVGNDINDVGGAVLTIGSNQRAMWHHLRWVLMPNTIQDVWNFVWSAWVRPLRSHLGWLIVWDVDWHSWIRYWVLESLAWAHAIIASQRAWRATYVYPQIQWLMSPPRVAYRYTFAIITEICQYLAYEGHTQDRDAIARVVIDQSPRLWRHTEQAILAFLQHPIDGTGFGSPLPQRPPGATDPPPPVPPQWEPWVTTPDFSYAPAVHPGLPEQDADYDGGIIGTD